MFKETFKNLSTVYLASSLTIILIYITTFYIPHQCNPVNYVTQNNTTQSTGNPKQAQTF